MRDTVALLNDGTCGRFVRPRDYIRCEEDLHLILLCECGIFEKMQNSLLVSFCVICDSVLLITKNEDGNRIIFYSIITRL